MEHVLGFCTAKEHRRFLEICPQFEQQVVDNGIRLLKYWLEVSPGEQKRRFDARIEDPLRQWKLSPTDLESRRRWYDYSRARDLMLEATDTEHAPWHVVRSDDKKRARLNCIAHLLEPDPLRARQAAEGRAGRPLEETRLRRRGPEGPLDPGGEVLIRSGYHSFIESPTSPLPVTKTNRKFERDHERLRSSYSTPAPRA